jgi:hypothetical protein
MGPEIGKQAPDNQDMKRRDQKDIGATKPVLSVDKG